MCLHLYNQKIKVFGMKLKSSSIFNFIFFGAIPVVALLVLFEFAITSNTINSGSSGFGKNPFNMETTVSNPQIVSAKKYLLEEESKNIKPVAMDYIDDSLYIFETASAKRFDLKREQDSVLQFMENKEDKIIADNQLIFQSSDNTRFGIQKIFATPESNASQTAIKIVNLATNESLFTIPNPTDPKTSTVFNLSNASTLSADKRYIALVFDNLSDPDSNKIIKIWDLIDGNTARDLEVSSYLNLKFTTDNNYLVINYNDQKPISFFSLKDISKDFSRDFDTFIDEYNFTDKPDEMLTLAYFDPNIDFQAFEKEVDKPIQVIRHWNYADNSKISENFITKSKVLKMFSLKDPNLILLVHENGILDFLDIKTHTVIKNYDSGVELKNVNDNRIALSTDQTQLIFYDQNGYIQIIEFSTDTKNMCSRFSFSIEGLRCLFRLGN